MASFDDPPLLGPRGLVGVPVARFVEPLHVGTRNTRLRNTQIVAEVWVASPTVTVPYVTQTVAEVWTKWRADPVGFPYSTDRMGPVGLLGIPPRTFRPRETFATYDPGANSRVAVNTIPDDRYGFGPRGFLGVPPRRFRESVLDNTHLPPPAPPAVSASAFLWVQ